MTPPWWAAVSPVSASVACGNRIHEIIWREGGLLLGDHPDVEAEGALGALGGPPPECLQVQAAWEAHDLDMSLITLGRRPGEAPLGFRMEEVAPVLGAFAAAKRPARRSALVAPDRSPNTAEGSGRAERRSQLMLLFCLPAPFIDRLVLTAMAAAAQAWHREDFRVAHGLRLGAALAARATPALRRFARPVAKAVPVHVHCAPALAGATGSVAAELAGGELQVNANLPLSWLSSVWGPGISEPDGCFVLGVSDVDAGALGVRLLEWEPAGLEAWVAVEREARLQRNDEGLYELL